MLRIALPAALANVTVPLAGLVDMALLGHLGSIHYLAGVGLCSIVFDYLYWTFGFLFMATQGLTAQAVGRRDQREVQLVLYRAFTLAWTLAAAILILQVGVRELGFAALAGAEDVESAGRRYFNARVWGAPAVLTNFALMGWFLGREKSAHVLAMTAVASFSNIALDYVLIYRFGLASLGAGLATMASQYLMLACGLLLFRPLRIRVGEGISRVFDRQSFKTLLSLNRDIMLRTLCLISAFATFMNISAILGTVVLAANAILLGLLSTAAYLIDGLSFATQSLAGIFKGEGDRKALVRLRRISLVWGEALAVAVVAVILLLPGPIYGLLTSHPELIETVRTYDGWFCVALLAGAVAYIYDGYFIGLTAGRIVRNAMLLSLAAFIAPAVLAWQSGSNHLLWAAFVIFMLARCGSLGVYQTRVLASIGSAKVSQ